MSGTAKMENSNVLKTKIFNSSVWKKPKSRIPMFKESHNPEFQYLEKPKQELNSSVWKEKNPVLQMFGRVKILKLNVKKIEKS